MSIFKKWAEEVTKETGIEVFPQQVEQFLGAFSVTESFWTACGIAHIPVPVASALAKKMLNEGYLEHDESDQFLLLTEKGKQAISDIFPDQFLSYKCPVCNGRTVDISSVPHWWRQFREIAENRPEPVQDYDQAYVTPETTLSRVIFLDMRGDLRGKKILVMGAEDDLTGLAIALTGLPQEVMILDIDERLINFDKEWIKKLNLKNVHAEVFDLRNPFPQEWKNRYDVFITDPPETPLAFKAFIGRGVWALKGKGSVGYFGLTLQDSSLTRWYRLQNTLLQDWKAVITDIIQDFNEYVPWQYHANTKAMKLAPVKEIPSQVWYRSAWYRIILLGEEAGSNEPLSEKALEELYLDEISSTT